MSALCRHPSSREVPPPHQHPRQQSAAVLQLPLAVLEQVVDSLVEGGRFDHLARLAATCRDFHHIAAACTFPVQVWSSEAVFPGTVSNKDRGASSDAVHTLRMRSLLACLTGSQHTAALRKLEVLWFPGGLRGISLPQFPHLRELDIHNAEREAQLSLCAQLPGLAPKLRHLSTSPSCLGQLDLKSLSCLEGLSVVPQCAGDAFPAFMHGSREVTLLAPDSLRWLRMEVRSSYRLTVVAAEAREFTRLGFDHHGLRLQCPRLQTCRLIWTEQRGLHLPPKYFCDFIIHVMAYLRIASDHNISRLELCLPSHVIHAIRSEGLTWEPVPACADGLPRCCQNDDKVVVAFPFRQWDPSAPLKDPYLCMACPPQQPRELNADYKARVSWYYHSIPFFSRNAYGLKE